MSFICIISSPENAGGGKKGLGRQGKKVNPICACRQIIGRTPHPDCSERDWAHGTILSTGWLDRVGTAEACIGRKESTRSPVQYFPQCEFRHSA